MRSAELLFGPVGVIRVTPLPDNKVEVTCRNGLTKEQNSFSTTQEIGDKIVAWMNGGKSNIQDAIPELDVDLREMCISGITDDEWKDIFDV
jgi:hypothetical protein